MGSVFGTSSAVEPVASEVLYSGPYAVKRYDPYFVAEIENENKSEAFAILADYLRKVKCFDKLPLSPRKRELESMQESHETQSSEGIEIAAPVITWDNALRFILPSRYTSIEQLPEPGDHRLLVKQVPSHVVAVLKFSGTCSEERVQRKLEKLLSMLAEDRIRILESSSTNTELLPRDVSQTDLSRQLATMKDPINASGYERVVMFSSDHQESKEDEDEQIGFQELCTVNIKHQQSLSNQHLHPQQSSSLSTNIASTAVYYTRIKGFQTPKWSLAQYDSPCTLPFLRRDEIWVELLVDDTANHALLEASVIQGGSSK